MSNKSCNDGDLPGLHFPQGGGRNVTRCSCVATNVWASVISTTETIENTIEIEHCMITNLFCPKHNIENLNVLIVYHVFKSNKAFSQVRTNCLNFLNLPMPYAVWTYNVYIYILNFQLKFQLFFIRLDQLRVS